MIVEYLIEPEDVVEMTEHLLERSPSHRASVRKAQLGAAVGAFVAASVAAYFSISWWSLALAAPIALGVGALTPQQSRLTVRKRLRAFLAESPKSHWEGTQRIDATD